MNSRSHLYLSSLFWDGWIIQQPVCREISQQEPVLYGTVRISSLCCGILIYGSACSCGCMARGAWDRSSGFGPLVVALGPVSVAVQDGIRGSAFVDSPVGPPRCSRSHPGVDNPLYERAVGRMGKVFPCTTLPTKWQRFRLRTHGRWRPRADASEQGRLALAAAEQLRAEKRRWHARVFTIWNAIDARIFQATNIKSGAFPELDELSGPKVAFVGVLDGWTSTSWRRRQRLAHAHSSSWAILCQRQCVAERPNAFAGLP
jgi:hypothetical protein